MGEKAVSAINPASKPRGSFILGVLLCMGFGISSAASAMDVVLAFTHVQARATSLDGATRAQMIINHLKRLDARTAAVFIRTREVTAKTQARVALYINAGHLLINTGHRHHLLSRPDLFRYQADLLAAHSRLKAYIEYQGHVYLANFESGEVISN